MTSKHQKVFDNNTSNYEFIATEADINELQQQIDNGGINPNTVIISANQVTETTEKRFISTLEKEAIVDNTSAIVDLNEEYIELKDLLDNTVTTDEKVKMTDSDVAGYLDSKLDNVTVFNENNMLVAKSLDGLTSTIEELNLTTGLTSNVQEQLNAIQGLGNFTTSVPTYNALMQLQNLTKDDLVIVIEDENFNNRTTIYIFNGDEWIYSGDFGTGMIRDFTVEPINLSTEVTGVLDKQHYEKSSAIDIYYDDTVTKLGASEVQTALLKLYEELDSIRTKWSNTIGQPLNNSDKLEQQLSKYKDLITILANNINEKGVNATENESLSVLANKVSAISRVNISVGKSKINKLNINGSGTIEVPLTYEYSEADITASLLEYIPGEENVVNYEVSFDNTDEDDFENNPDVSFDGVLKLDNKQSSYVMIEDESWSEEGYLNYLDVTRTEWSRFDKIEVDTW